VHCTLANAFALAEAKTKIELSASEPAFSGFQIPARSGLEIPPSADAFVKAAAKVALGSPQ
jgi:hypothetical protein